VTKLKFSIVVHSAPYSSAASRSALKFCQALLERKQKIVRVFFFRDGVHNVSQLTVVPQDEENLQHQWEALLSKHQIDSVACITSALKRGVIDAGEAHRYEKPASNIMAATEIGGLGQLVDACLSSDRVVNFG
jgi:tRNA 2-thiouridine synthesizing protein D